MAIVVTNNSGAELTDRFNGVDLVFPVGKKVLLDADAARHIFGFGDGDKVPYLARLGWLRTNQDYDTAMARLAQFSFQSFDPYAQFDEAAPADQSEQQLSPVASGTEAEAVSDGPATVSEPTPAAPPATDSGSILARLQGAVA